MSQPQPISFNGAAVDLSTRVVTSKVVAASPTAAVETIIATLTIPAQLVINSGIEVVGWAAYTVGTNGVSGQLQIKRTNASGTAVTNTGALTVTAANLVTGSAHGFDTGATLPGQVYVLTLTVGSASAGSTVSAVYLRALVI